MPTFAAQTTAVMNNGAPIWQSPDGQRKIWQITMRTPQGAEVPGLKTYSQAIAQMGWNGTVETYEKQGRNGVETFVKQPQEAAQQAGGGQPSSTGGGYPKPQPDPFTTFLGYAKDVYCAHVAADKSLSEAELLFELKKMTAGGEFLYDMRPGNPNRKLPESGPAMSAAEPTMQELNRAFPVNQADDNGSSPWPNQQPNQ